MLLCGVSARAALHRTEIGGRVGASDVSACGGAGKNDDFWQTKLHYLHVPQTSFTPTSSTIIKPLRNHDSTISVKTSFRPLDGSYITSTTAPPVRPVHRFERTDSPRPTAAEADYSSDLFVGTYTSQEAACPGSKTAGAAKNSKCHDHRRKQTNYHPYSRPASYQSTIHPTTLKCVVDSEFHGQRKERGALPAQTHGQQRQWHWQWQRQWRSGRQ